MTHPSTVADTLDAAADKLAAPGAWTQGTFARNANCEKVAYSSPQACSWCAAGALRSVTDDPGIRLRAASLLLQQCGGLDIIAYNDMWPRTQEDVVGVFHAAAASAREQGL